MTNNQQSGAIVRQDFGGTSIQKVGETAALAVAAQAKAAIEARWIIAKDQPRDLDTVRLDLVRECQRPSFAAVAIYRKPIGAGIEGLSIRFVEQALQAMGNVDTESVTIFDDADKRIVEVRVTDFQRNVCHRKQLTITKLVERLYLKKGQVPVSQRVNSSGKTTYLVHASEDDLLNKEGAMVSKAIRTCGLRVIPGWLQDECEQIIRKTAADEAARDPDAEKRKLLDGFGQIGVMPGDLEEYLGHPLGQMVPAELVQLRNIWKTIQAGEATWVDTLAHHQHLRGDEKPAATSEATTAQQGTQGVKDALARRAKPQAPPPPPKAEEPTPAEKPPAIEIRVEDVTPETLDAAVALPTEKPAPVSSKELPQGKRPSSSKVAQAERKEELRALGHAPGKFATLYIKYGDPRNLAKSAAAMDSRLKEEARIEMEAKEAAAKVQAEGNVATTPGGAKHDATTGEVIEGEPEEPDWMSKPPAREGF